MSLLDLIKQKIKDSKPTGGLKTPPKNNGSEKKPSFFETLKNKKK